jgi:hypothetical protein
MNASRLSIDRTTLLPSIQTFGELSHFLRGAVADEDCRQFGESMGTLATHIEAIVAGLRLSRARAVAPLLMDLLTVLRGHRALVMGLGVAWRGLYEYAAYLQALNNFRVLIGQWLLDGGSQSEMLGLTRGRLRAGGLAHAGRGHVADRHVRAHWPRVRRPKNPPWPRWKSPVWSGPWPGGKSCGCDAPPHRLEPYAQSLCYISLHAFRSPFLLF